MIGELRLTTSQFVTAPKRATEYLERVKRLTTSQFVTAPKRHMGHSPGYAV